MIHFLIINSDFSGIHLFFLFVCFVSFSSVLCFVCCHCGKYLSPLFLSVEIDPSDPAFGTRKGDV